jgi:hypothetical protein
MQDGFVQVMNKAFPGGLLSVAEAVKMMNEGATRDSLAFPGSGRRRAATPPRRPSHPASSSSNR